MKNSITTERISHVIKCGLTAGLVDIEEVVQERTTDLGAFLQTEAIIAAWVVQQKYPDQMDIHNRIRHHIYTLCPICSMEPTDTVTVGDEKEGGEVVLTYHQTQWIRSMLQELDLDLTRPLGILIEEEEVELIHDVLDRLWKKLVCIAKRNNNKERKHDEKG